VATAIRYSAGTGPSCEPLRIVRDPEDPGTATQ
jgi:hypothetical protein